MYTKADILALAAEYYSESKNRVYVPVYYKRHGQMVRRQFDDVVYSERWHELNAMTSPLRTERIFKSSESGNMLAYFDLEVWMCDFEEDYYISHCEYEESMGEDL
jgi:hypothetical protein